MPKHVSNPPNPWESTSVEWIGPPPAARLEVFEEQARSILSENDSPDLGFRYSVNPYRGCQHACAYCYARPSHEFLSFGAGTDFEKKIVVKRNAVELLIAAFRSKSWRGEVLAFSGVTDCYQPLEASYRLTRGLLEVCARYRNPVAIVTKSTLVQRDLDLLEELNRGARASVTVSIPILDPTQARALETGAPTPADRFATIAKLAERGIPTAVAISPIIPGLTESQIPEILERAAAAGVTSAWATLLRLPERMQPVFRERLEAAFPDRAKKILSAQRQMRGGQLEDARYGERFHGRGPRWDVVRRLFELECKRHGLDTNVEDQIRTEPATEVREPTADDARGPRQGTLFGP